MNKFTTILADIFKLIPYVVAGINVVHSEKDSTSKIQIAQDVLGVATQAAVQALPADETATAQAVSAAVGTSIQSVQAIHDALTPPVAPAPAA